MLSQREPLVGMMMAQPDEYLQTVQIVPARPSITTVLSKSDTAVF